MAQLVHLEDATDSRLGDYVALRDTSLRKHLESAEGLFIAEGAKIIRRALEAGYRPRSFLLAERWLGGLADLLDAHDVPVFQNTGRPVGLVPYAAPGRGLCSSMSVTMKLAAALNMRLPGTSGTSRRRRSGRSTPPLASIA